MHSFLINYTNVAELNLIHNVNVHKIVIG